MAEFKYAGNELGLFAQALNWKSYWKRALSPYLADDVLEVGSGIGENTRLLASEWRGSWTCLEPDRGLLEKARRQLALAGLDGRCELVCGTLASIDTARLFDTIVYLDVLEHIDDDRTEMELAAEHVEPGGRIVVLAPAHQSLFGEFDRAVGHMRRYDRRALAAALASAPDQPEEILKCCVRAPAHPKVFDDESVSNALVRLT